MCFCDPQQIIHKSHQQLTAVVFTSPWSGAGNMILDTLQRVQNIRTELQVISCDATEIPDTATYFGVTSIPTTIVLREGEIVYQFTEPQSCKAIVQRLKAL